MTPRGWSAFRWLIALAGLVVEVRVAIPDYPYGYRLWYWACCDPNGWLHEAFYIAVGFLVLIDLSYHWERKEAVMRRVRRLRGA